MATRISYNIRQAFQQLWRNKGMAIASLFAITAMLLILGLFFVVSVNIEMFTETLRNDYNELEIYLEDDITAAQAQSMQRTIETYGGVKETSYRTKEEAMTIMKTRWGENSYLLDTLGDNPFPNSILVTVDSMEAADNVISQVEKLDGVEDIKYYKETVEKLSRINEFLQIAAIVIMVFLVVVAVVVVSNTIKLTVFARQKEIEIAKYIGATNWFIRGPFLVEGIILGVISSLVAALITYFVYDRIIALIGTQLITMISTPLVSAEYLSLNLVLIFMAMGVGIGASGSIISMRKFLDT